MSSPQMGQDLTQRPGQQPQEEPVSSGNDGNDDGFSVRPMRRMCCCYGEVSRRINANGA
jgi:hypothetical protein